VSRNPEESKTSKYTYGPVPSRRLGFSLGIDIIPHKNCSFDCIYCQLGKTLNKTLVRKEYAPVDCVLNEVRTVLKSTTRIDYLTFSGSGEPTLHKRIGYLITEVKKLTKIPVAVLTNGSLLYLPEVRCDLLDADLVAPTLCTVDEKIFQKIHRGHAGLDIDKIIQGYIEFRKTYKGKIWLEVMMIKGINDEPDTIEELKRAIDRIKPDKIHLNTVVRPPSENYARPVPQKTLQNIKTMLGNKCEIIADFKSNRITTRQMDQLTRIEAIIARRPVTIDDLTKISGLHRNEIIKATQVLVQQAKIVISKHQGRIFYRTIRGTDD
jgi:wyosine [tRNA(Phe)-imidazoG37] synthetase (radical SAM superfamily)